MELRDRIRLAQENGLKYIILDDDYRDIVRENCPTQRVYRIMAVKDFVADNKNVTEGRLGGYIASDENLSHEGSCWVWGNSIVMDDATVDKDAQVVGETTRIYDFTYISDEAKVVNSVIYGGTYILGSARVKDSSIYASSLITNTASVVSTTINKMARIQASTCLRNSVIGTTKSSGSETIRIMAGDFVSAQIDSQNDFIVIENVGMEKGHLTIYKAKKGVLATRGCFLGSLSQFLKAVEERFARVKKSDPEYKKHARVRAEYHQMAALAARRITGRKIMSKYYKADL
jgi:conserved hypothetical protein|nr:MAG TPA: Putative transferase, nesg, ydcK, Structural Genomics.38A [Caudoviricetes sp.]